MKQFLLGLTASLMYALFVGAPSASAQIESDYYHALDLKRAAQSEWGKTAQLNLKGKHLYDWEATVDNGARPIDLKAAAIDQYGDDWTVIATGLGAFDWGVARFSRLPEAVLPVILVASDKLYDVSGADDATKCFGSALEGVQKWYKLRCGKTFRLLKPVLIITDVTSRQWVELSERTAQMKERFVLFDESKKAYLKALPPPEGRFKVAISQFVGKAPKTGLGAAALGDFAVVTPANASIFCPAAGVLSAEAKGSMYGIGHELGHTFGLTHPCDEKLPDCNSSIMQASHPPEAILLPHEAVALRKSSFFN